MDQLRSTIIARAESLGLTANAISVRCGGSPNPEATRRYLTERCHLGSQYVSKICEVLVLELRARKPVKTGGKAAFLRSGLAGVAGEASGLPVVDRPE